MFVIIFCKYVIFPLVMIVLCGPIIGGVLGSLAFTQAIKEDKGKPVPLIEGEDYNHE
jgi:hypothetical protein